MEIVLYLLIAQGLLGGFDVIWNHEWHEKLPSKPSASLEQVIHGIREILYSIVFLGLAWFRWQGLWAWVFIMLIVTEIVLTGWDFVVEDQTRKLSPTERIAHLILSMNGGAYVALLLPTLLNWVTLPDGLISIDYGNTSLWLSVLGIGVFCWGVRDLYSGIRLTKNASDDLSTEGAMWS
jgi:phosphatidylglycerophosphate synthase